MMVPELREKGQQHANHSGKRIAHLWLGLLPLRYTSAFRVAVQTWMMFMA